MPRIFFPLLFVAVNCIVFGFFLALFDLTMVLMSLCMMPVTFHYLGATVKQMIDDVRLLKG